VPSLKVLLPSPKVLRPALKVLRPALKGGALRASPPDATTTPVSIFFDEKPRNPGAATPEVRKCFAFKH
jgi:hypothetical protein